MGRRKRNKKQNFEALTPDQFQNEEAQQGDPIDQEQGILPDPEAQNYPEPNAQKEEIHQDFPDDPIPNPSREEQETHQDSQDDPQQNQEPEEEIHRNSEKHQEQEEVYQEPVVEQGVPQALIVEVTEQEILIAELDAEDQHKEDMPLSRSKKQNCEASAPDQIHDEAQQGDPIDQEQVRLSDPEEQVDPKPNTQQEEIHQSPPVDPIPNPSREEQKTHHDLQENPDQIKEQEDEVPQNLQKHPEQEHVYQESVVEQGVPQALIVEVTEQETLIAELDVGDQQKEDLPLTQENLERETEPSTVILRTSHENPDTKVKTLVVPTTLEKSQETEVETRVGVALQDDPQQNQEPEEIHQNLQKHQEPVVEQGVPQAFIVEVAEQQRMLIAELNAEDQHKEIMPLSQEIFERETEPATLTSRNSLENPEQKVETLGVPTTLEGSQETEVETRVGVTPVSHKRAETGVPTSAMVSLILQESPIQAVPINLVSQETEVKTQIGVSSVSQESAESEVERQAVVVSPVLQQSSAQDIETQQTRANLGSHGGSDLEMEIVPSENLQRNELSIHSEKEIDENEEQKLLHFTENIEPQPTQHLPDPIHISLLSFQESSALVSLLKMRDYEADMRSDLQKREDLEQLDKSEISPKSQAEATDALSVGLQNPMMACARKHKKERESSKPGHADSTKHQELLEYENPPLEDTEEPDFADTREPIKLIESQNAELSSPEELQFSDPKELLKDLNFGEMKADNQETKLANKLKLDIVVNLRTEDDDDLKTEVGSYTISEYSGYLEMEERKDLETGDSKAEDDEKSETQFETEGDEDVRMENHEDLEMDNHGHVEVEVCGPLRPSAAQPPPADGNLIPNDLEEDSPNESLPSDGGNTEGSRKECTIETQEVPNKNGDPYFGLTIVIGCTLLFISFTILLITSFAKKIVYTRGNNSKSQR